MHTLLLLAFLFFGSFTSAESTVELEEGVYVLTDDTFDDFIETHDYVLAEFYAPWCGHCKQLAPIFASAAKKLKDLGHAAVLAKIDCTVHTKLASKYEISGYPTLKFFREQTPIEYEGGRSVNDIVNFIKKKSSPASLKISTESELINFIADEGTKIIIYAEENSDYYQKWIKTVKGAAFGDFICGHVVSSLWGDNPEGKIVLHKTGEEPLEYSGKFTKTALTKWATEEGYPLVDVLSQASWTRAVSSKLPLLSVFSSDITSLSYLTQLARENKAQVVFTSSDLLELASRWGASGNVFPTAIYVTWVGEQPKMTVWDEDSSVSFNEDSLRAFINDAKKGTYVSYKKSEPIPEHNDEPVQVLVGKTIEQVIHDKSKDVVFIEFYSPSCGHCKKLAPVWDELGLHYENNENVVIGKIDATVNSLPDDISIRGYPTLIAFVGGVQKQYSGNRDFDSLKTFVDSFLGSGDADKHDL